MLRLVKVDNSSYVNVGSGNITAVRAGVRGTTIYFVGPDQYHVTDAKLEELVATLERRVL